MNLKTFALKIVPVIISVTIRRFWYWYLLDEKYQNILIYSISYETLIGPFAY